MLASNPCVQLHLHGSSEVASSGSSRRLHPVGQQRQQQQQQQLGWRLEQRQQQQQQGQQHQQGQPRTCSARWARSSALSTFFSRRSACPWIKLQGGAGLH